MKSNENFTWLKYINKLVSEHRISKVWALVISIMLFTTILPNNSFIPTPLINSRANPDIPDYLFELTIKPNRKDVGNDPLNPLSRRAIYPIEIRNYEDNVNVIRLTIIEEPSLWPAELHYDGQVGDTVLIPVPSRGLALPGQPVNDVDVWVTADASVAEGDSGTVKIKGECDETTTPPPTIPPPFEYVSCITTMNSYEPYLDFFTMK